MNEQTAWLAQDSSSSSPADKIPLYVVLGMHRGGTSVAARALQALGVSLGDNLLPPAPNNNETGFWEDADIARHNDKVLAAFDETWNSVRVLDERRRGVADMETLAAKGRALLSAKLRTFTPYGFKDPRTPRVLFYWQNLFRALRVKPHYLLVVRNPLSVAQSLEKRDGFPPERSHLLWLQHMLLALRGSDGERRVIVDYDRFIADPVGQLEIIRRGFHMPVARQPLIDEFSSGFLSDALRHSHFSAEDLRRDPQVPRLTVRLYELLEQLACDRIPDDAPKFRQEVDDIWARALDVAPVFALAEMEHRRWKSDIQEWSKVVADRDRQVAHFTRLVAERDKRVARCEADVAKLSLAVNERDGKISQLGGQLYSLEIRLDRILRSTFWLATWPLQVAWRYVEDRVLTRKFIFDVAPNSHLVLSKPPYDWQATGDDPSFHMQPVADRYPAGWVTVKTRLVRHSKDRTLKLYWDCGGGMSEATATELPVAHSGAVNQLIWVPSGIKHLRWDPMQGPGAFMQEPIVMYEPGPVARWLHRIWRIWRARRVLRHDALRQSGLTFARMFTHAQRSYEIATNLLVREADAAYATWLETHALTQDDRQEIRKHISHLADQPLISVLMPVFNTAPEFLRAAITSVRSQLYENWELCIADDASTSQDTKDVIESFRHADPRIKVEYRAVNGHISAASNTALNLATGDFIALVDHDDLLAEDALYQVVVELNRHPDADIIYSDEDKIDVLGKRWDPHFKSDWNPDLLYSQNYVSHLGVYRTGPVRAAGGFREGFEGSQDYDLLLRCIAKADPPGIRHIPAILYHWRATAGSTAQKLDNKGYATESGIRALKDHFHGRGLRDVVISRGPHATTYRVRYPLPNRPPKTSLIIPTRDRVDVLRVCIESIRAKTTYSNYEIVVVDNRSSDPRTLAYLEDLSATGVRVLSYDEPFNYSALNNFAVERVDGELVGLINNDIEVISPGWLTEMVSQAVRPGVGAVGAKLYYSDNSIQHAGVVLGIGGVAGHSHKYMPRSANGYFARLQLVQNVSAVTGACLIVRRESYQRVGGLDAKNLTIAFNDVDFCLRLSEIGLRNVWTPWAELFHHESVSRGAEDTPEKVKRFQTEIAYMKQRWGDHLLSDPFYNPMLSLERENFAPDFRNPPPKPWLDGT